MRRRLLPFLCAIALTAAFAAQGPAFAQPATPSAADRDTARKLLDDGDAAFAKGDFEGALKAYQAAHGIMNLPSTGIEVAKAQAQVGQLIEARETALEVARMPTVPREPPVFATSRKEATDLAAQLDPRIPSVRVQLAGLAAGVTATVSIDGAPIPPGGIGLPRRVDPGSHKITVTAPGYEDASSDITIQEGATTDVPIELKAAAKKAVVVVPPPKKPPAHKLSVFLPIGLATTGVGLGVTLGAGIAALKGCHKGAGCPAAIAADVGLGVAVAGAALTTAGIVLTIKGGTPTSDSPSATPTATDTAKKPRSPEMRLSIGSLWRGGFVGMSSEFQ